MRVTFVLPFPHWTGGVRVVYEYTRRLRARGHRVRVVCPFVPFRFRPGPGPWSELRPWLRSLLRNARFGARPPRNPVAWQIEMVPWIADRFMPDADAVVATAWPTAIAVARLAARKGAGVYLVQHRELDSGPAPVVDATYRLPLFRVAGSHFTANVLQRELGVTVEAVVPNGVDTAFWGGAPADERAGVLTVLIPGERKGAGDAVDALERIRRARPDLTIRAFGHPRALSRRPAFLNFVSTPSDDELRDLYTRAEVFLYASRFEGFGLPPLEAMAAGCVVVSTRVGEVPEFVEHGVCGELVEPRDVEGMARAVLGLLQDPARLKRMGLVAAQRALARDWEIATTAFEGALGRAVEGAAGG